MKKKSEIKKKGNSANNEGLQYIGLSSDQCVEEREAVSKLVENVWTT